MDFRSASWLKMRYSSRTGRDMSSSGLSSAWLMSCLLICLLYISVLTIVGVLLVVILLNYAIVPLVRSVPLRLTFLIKTAGYNVWRFLLIPSHRLVVKRREWTVERITLYPGQQFFTPTCKSNKLHQKMQLICLQGLTFYQPRLSSRIFIALMWAFA